MCEVSGAALEELIRKNQIVLTKKQNAYLKVKRVLDFLAAFLALIVLSPVFLIVAIAIKLDAPKEKVIFKQERIGQNGKTFTLYKFRSMKKDTPELGTNEFTDAEAYITKVGKLIRRTSLDELPQLWSVLTGKMSLIGERPLIPREDSVHYLRNYYGIYQVKPGITGLAQINGRDVVSDYDKVRWDRAYVQNISFLLDLKIFFRTITQVLKCEGVIDDAMNKKTAIASKIFHQTDEQYRDEIQGSMQPEEKKCVAVE